jgi:hypothetical protein
VENQSWLSEISNTIVDTPMAEYAACLDAERSVERRLGGASVPRSFVDVAIISCTVLRAVEGRAQRSGSRRISSSGSLTFRIINHHRWHGTALAKHVDDDLSAETARELGDTMVAKNLLRLRFCIICHSEMTDEICCTCETPTVLKTSA